MVSLVLAAIGVLAVFIALNHTAYNGFFTDDELDNLSWGPLLPAWEFVKALLDPRFSKSNFRPVGHAYFAIMGRVFGLDFPPYITPLLAIHLINGGLIFAILRRLKVGAWQSLAGATFFLLSAGAFDAYWKPMYVFDLLCTLFCLLALLLYANGRTVLAFISFWLAYKAKELAVLLPAVLFLYEYWFGQRRFLRLVPFGLVSVCFGLQGILLNPNHNNDYTFRFTKAALRAAVPFYAERFLYFPLSGFALFALAFVRDRRVWFGLAGMSILVTTLLFLPGRLFIAYAYLPLAFASIAIASAGARIHPAWLWLAIALWMPRNLREHRHLRHAQLAADDQAYAFVSGVMRWGAEHRGVETLVYDGVPANFHNWGVTAAWNIAHHRIGPHAFFSSSAEASRLLASQTVAYAHWQNGGVIVQSHSPGDPTP